MIIAPSILAADFGNLEKSIARVKETKWLHVDVMDGHFVPNISIGPVVVKGLKKYTNQVLDTHLMITDPMKYIKPFIDAGSDRITFHIETVSNPIEVIEYIKKFNVKVGISIKPNTQVSEIEKYIPFIDQVLVMSVEPGFGGQQFMMTALEKMTKLRTLKEELNKDLLIVVDGGINDITSTLCKSAGADVLVAGSYLFNSENISQKIASLKK